MTTSTLTPEPVSTASGSGGDEPLVEEPNKDSENAAQEPLTSLTEEADTKKSIPEKDDFEVENEREKAKDRLIGKCTLVLGLIMLLAGGITLAVNKMNDDGEDGSSNLTGFMLLAGGVIATSWGWLFRNTSDNEEIRRDKQYPSEDDDDDDDDDDEIASSSSGAQNRTVARQKGPSNNPPPRPLMRNRLNDELADGEVPFDKLLVGGTLSLGFILLLGGLAILIIALVDRAGFGDVDADDFQSLGPFGCRIQRSASYKVVTNRLDALNSRCVEIFQYEVQAAEDPMSSFYSTILSRVACRTSCELCPSSNLQGENTYIGVDSTRAGVPITNSTFVECWEPTKPVSQLSDFYSCGVEGGQEVEPQAADQCFQLVDVGALLGEELGSSQAAFIAGIIGVVGAACLTGIGLFFVRRNILARRKHRHEKELIASPDEKNNHPDDARICEDEGQREEDA